MKREWLIEIIEREVDMSDFAHRKDEFDDVAELLLTHKTLDNKETQKLARVMAFSCLGSNHLWQDMRLRNREELSKLIQTYFKLLFDKNYKDMKWKKFFYRQICGWEGFTACRSPSCDICIDYSECFGPETD